MQKMTSKLFVALPSESSSGLLIFGMNSFLPKGEVQEVIYYPASDQPTGLSVKCTNVEIDQVEHINAVVLSKPVCCWGAEMGANEHGVCIGFAQLPSLIVEHGLTGQDLVRLGLERAVSAENAVDIVTELVTAHGLTSHVDGAWPSGAVSMLICDRLEAWILEGAGKHVAALRVKSGVKHLNGFLTIRTEFDKSSPALREFAVEHNKWSEGDGDFDFAAAFSNSAGVFEDNQSLQQLVGEADITPVHMLNILRNSEYHSGTNGYSAASSMLSLLPCGSAAESGSLPYLPACVHWFTATPKPEQSFFKPFVFNGDQTSVCDKTTAPCHTIPNSEHALWMAHRRFLWRLEGGDKKSESVLSNIRELEQKCFEDVDELIRGEASKPEAGGSKGEHVLSLFKHMVDLEINFYN